MVPAPTGSRSEQATEGTARPRARTCTTSTERQLRFQSGSLRGRGRLSGLGDTDRSSENSEGRESYHALLRPAIRRAVRRVASPRNRVGLSEGGKRGGRLVDYLTRIYRRSSL